MSCNALDRIFMQRAISLAWSATGRVSPNPLVGAVIVANRKIVAEGCHRQYGDRHAEAEAINNCRQPLAGATIYITLEPCCYRDSNKKQPPCTELLLTTGIKRVVIANRDPNPKVSGAGIARLRSHGLQVDEGVEAEEAAKLNQGFFHRINYQRPFVQLKLAQSLDGCTACDNGNSQWITNINARRLAHRLRRHSDAILIGSQTALQDNPSLTVRHCSGPSPLRVVLDRQLRIPRNYHIFDGQQQTLLVTSQSQPEQRLQWYLQRGVAILPLPATKQLPLDVLLQRLASDYHCQRLLVEGGTELHSSLIRHQLYDQLLVFVAPMLLAGRAGIAKLGYQQVSDAAVLQHLNCHNLADDQLLISLWRTQPLIPSGQLSSSWSALDQLGAAD